MKESRTKIRTNLGFTVDVVQKFGPEIIGYHAEASTGRNIKLMDRAPRLWVRFPIGEACHKHPGPDLVLTAEPIKTGIRLCTKTPQE